MQLDRETNPWAGQLYISHTSEATCKLLYKKFFRKTDSTILHGPWKQILLEQQKAYFNENSTGDLPSHGVKGSQSVELNQLDTPTSSPENPFPSVARSPSAKRMNNALSSIPLSSSTLSTSSSSSSTPPHVGLMDLPSPSSFPSMHSPRATHHTHLCSYKRRSRATQYNNSDSRTRLQLISSSRHGIVSPAELEPFQCFVLFYTSSWVVPQIKNRRLTRIFGPNLVPKIEQHIRDEYNGEQCPGTSFMLETGSLPCKYIVCTSVARNINCLSTDYAYNAFRSALLSIYNFNKHQYGEKQTVM